MIPSAVFVPAVATQEQIFTLQQISEKFLGVCQRPLHMFCRTRGYIWPVSIEKLGMRCGNTVLTATCYCPTAVFRILRPCRRSKSQPFTVCVGLRQACVLSPLLFIFYINWTDSHSQVDDGVSGATGSTVFLLQTIWFCSYLLNRVLNMHPVGFQLRASKWEWKLALQTGIMSL